MSNSILCLVGETASGKTERAIRLAVRMNGEIIGADSRQIYRDMPIGTALPTPQELARVAHHVTAFLDPSERYSAARYVRDAVAAVIDIRLRDRRPFIVGGTGFYVRALSGDVVLGPAPSAVVRSRVLRESDLHETPWLHEWLRILDPQRAASVVTGDRYRIMRALEVALTQRLPAAEQTIAAPGPTLAEAGFKLVKAWVRVAPEVLIERIEKRVDAMLAAGFLEEAHRIGDGVVAADAVGYPAALAYLAGQMTHAELRRALIRATRRYAKRQATWLRREPGLHVLTAGPEVDAQLESLALG